MITPEADRSLVSQNNSRSATSHSIWEIYGHALGSLLVVGHGTRNQTGVAQLLELVGQMQIQAPAVRIQGCFLELAEPSIEDAMERLHEQGVKKTLIVPVLLFTAGHALQDIPNAVFHAARKFGIDVVGQTESLGIHPSVLALSQSRFFEVTRFESGHGCPLRNCPEINSAYKPDVQARNDGHFQVDNSLARRACIPPNREVVSGQFPRACARVHCAAGQCEGKHISIGRIGLAMVGRGSSDLQAIAHMRNFTELKVAQLAVARYQTGFFACEQPNVDELLREASAWECDTVIVQPHLLFEGELVEQLRQKVLQFQMQFPDKQWLVSRTLGADPKLADVFLELAQEKLTLSPNATKFPFSRFRIN